MMRAVVVGMFALLAGTAAADDPVLLAPRLYRATIETGLPHLEENLRYATTHETLCLGGDQLADAFPILRHVAFEGCALGDAQRDGDAVNYHLHCARGNETTGTARWSIEAAQLTGTFEARLGGKNMTLYQRITARAAGACGAATNVR